MRLVPLVLQLRISGFGFLVLGAIPLATGVTFDGGDDEAIAAVAVGAGAFGTGGLLFWLVERGKMVRAPDAPVGAHIETRARTIRRELIRLAAIALIIVAAVALGGWLLGAVLVGVGGLAVVEAHW